MLTFSSTSASGKPVGLQTQGFMAVTKARRSAWVETLL